MSATLLPNHVPVLYSSRMGNARFRSLNDFSRQSANVGCVCRSCGHKGVVHRDLFARWAFLKRVNVSIENLPGYLRCTKCGARPGRIAPTPLPPTIPRWGTDDYSKRLQRKLRG